MRRPLSFASIACALLASPAVALDWDAALRARLNGDDSGNSAGRIDLVVTGGTLTSPEFRLTITPEGDGASRVEVVDLKESIWAATVDFDESPPTDEAAAWQRVQRTQFTTTTATCPALEPAIAAFVAVLEAKLVVFHAEPQGPTLEQVTSHSGLVELRATDADFVQVTLRSRSGGLNAFLPAADAVTRAAGTCENQPVRMLASIAREPRDPD